MTLKRLALTICFACCLFSIALPVVMTFLIKKDFGYLGPGPFWLMIGNHFLLIPLTIIMLFSSYRTGEVFLLPLTTWLLMIVNLSIFLSIDGLTPAMTVQRQCELSSYFLIASIAGITLVYLKLRQMIKAEQLTVMQVKQEIPPVQAGQTDIEANTISKISIE